MTPTSDVLSRPARRIKCRLAKPGPKETKVILASQGFPVGTVLQEYQAGTGLPGQPVPREWTVLTVELAETAPRESVASPALLVRMELQAR